MANHLNTRSNTLDRGFQALADATRRAVLVQLAAGEASVAELAAPHDMALPSFLQHVRVLEAAGLITTRKEGRVRTCRLEAARLAELNKWITGYETGWRRRLSKLDDILEGKDKTK